MSVTVTATILAGGRASRLGGRAKSALCVGSQTILERQVAVLRQVASRIVLVGAPRAPVGVRGLAVVHDLVRGAGPLGGIYTAIRTARSGLALVVACDLPFLTAPFLGRLVTEADGVDVALPRTTDGYHPLCAVYAPGAAEPIRQRIRAGRFKVIDALADLRVREVGPEEIAQYDPDGTLLLNINTPDDYQRALKVPGRG